MSKLKLEIETLAVDTFHATPADAEAPGTVEAFEISLIQDTCGCNNTSRKMPCAPCTEFNTCMHCD